MEQFSIINKNKGMCCVETQNKYCFKYRAVFSIRKPNIANVTHWKLLEKNILLNFPTGAFTALGCHERTTLFPSSDHKHNVGKCRFTRAVVYYILLNYSLCWHSCSLSRIRKVLALPQVLSLHMFLPFCVHHRRCTATNSADTADSCSCNVCYLRTSDWPSMRCYISPLSIFRGFPKMLLHTLHLRCTHKYNFMLNSSFKQIEEFTHAVLPETCCPGLLLACGCLRLRCECRFVNPQYHFVPAVSVLIRCVRKLF